MDPSVVEEVVKKKVEDEQHREVVEERDNLRRAIIADNSNLKKDMRIVNFAGMLFALAACVMLIVAFATSEWIVYNVTYPTDPLQLTEENNYICSVDSTIQGTQTCSMFFTRHRGLFFTFYNNPSFFASAYAPDMYFQNNVWEQGYQLPNTPLNHRTICGNEALLNNTMSISSITARTSLMRAHWVTFLIGIILLFFSTIFSLSSFFGARLCTANMASTFAIFGMIMALIGMGCFHGYIYMETSLLNCPPFIAILNKPFFSTLKSSTTSYFGYSMYIGWGSVASALIGSIALCVFSCNRMDISSRLDKEKYRLYKINKHTEKERELRLKEEKRIAAQRVKMAKKDANNKLQHVQEAADANEITITNAQLEANKKQLAEQEQRLAHLNNVLRYSPPPSPTPFNQRYSPVPQFMPPQMPQQMVMPPQMPPQMPQQIVMMPQMPPQNFVPIQMPPQNVAPHDMHDMPPPNYNMPTPHHGMPPYHDMPPQMKPQNVMPLQMSPPNIAPPHMPPPPSFNPMQLVDQDDPYTLHLPTGNGNPRM